MVPGIFKKLSENMQTDGQTMRQNTEEHRKNSCSTAVISGDFFVMQRNDTDERKAGPGSVACPFAEKKVR